MINRSLILNDFTQVKNLSQDQLRELISELDQLSSFVSGDLSAALESFAEIAADKSGKTAQAQKLLKEIAIKHRESVQNSFAYQFLVAGMIYHAEAYEHASHLRLISLRGSITPRQHLEADPLRVNWKSLSLLGYPFRLPWAPFAPPSYYKDERSRSFWRRESSLRKITSRYDLSFLLEPTTIGRDDLEPLFFDLDLVARGKDDLSIDFDYFKNPVLKSVLREMLASREARNAILTFIAKVLSEKVRGLTGIDDIPKWCIAEASDIMLNDEYSEDLGVIESRYPDESFERLCVLSFKKLSALTPDEHFPEWGMLKSAAEHLYISLLTLTKEREGAIALLAGDDEDLLFGDIYEFLEFNGLDPLVIPTISELGKCKGGFALVKRISAAGGLKVVRGSYAPWAAERFDQDVESLVGSKQYQLAFGFEHENKVARQADLFSFDSPEDIDDSSLENVR